MTKETRYHLSRRNVLAGLGTIGVASAGAGLGTTAFFNDTESVEASFEAGRLDLVVEYFTAFDQGSAGTGSDQGVVNGTQEAEYTYTLADVKPGDSGVVALCPRVVTNDAWLWIGNNDGLVDYENGQNEPEGDVDSTGGGSIGTANTGAGFGELSEAIEVTVSYAESVSRSGDTVTCETTRELNNPEGYTLADLAKDLTGGFLLDGDQDEPSPDDDPTPYPGSENETIQQGPCLCIEWVLPTTVGNEIQSDGVEFTFSLVAEQARHNDAPVTPFVDAFVGAGGSIQAAVDAASPGDVIGVAAETFTEQVTVSVADLTLIGRGEATIDGNGGSAPVTIAADGVRLDGFEITNPGGLIGIAVDPGVNGVTICNNRIFDIGPTGSLGVTGIVFGTEATGGHDDVVVFNNIIETLRQEDDGSFATVNGILFNTGNSPGTITNVSIRSNVFRDFESTTAPLGIVVQQDTNGVTIADNEFRDFLADNSLGAGSFDTFAQGLNVANSANTDFLVSGNVFGADILSNDGFYPEAIKVEANVDVSGIQITGNDLLTAFGLTNAASGTVNAETNYWNDPAGPNATTGQLNDGTVDSRPTAASVSLGLVDSDPFLSSSVQ